MKIKIIDLLNKIANGEEVPKKIKYNNKIYEYYERLENIFNYKQIVNGKYIDDYFNDNYFIDSILNDEVEIIEEPKKIEKVSWREKESLAGNITEREKQNILARRTEKLKAIINELIVEINNLKENKYE